MRMKLTKTIATIVFVVFLGLIKTSDVSAADLSCYYYDEDTVAITVTIPSGMGSATASEIEDYEYGTDSARTSISILNWKRSEAEKYKVNSKKYKDAGTSFKDKNGDVVVYNGYDDVWLNEKCPQYLIIVNENFGVEDSWVDMEVRQTFLMFSDSANVSKVKKYLKDAIEANIVTYVERAEAIPLKATSGAKEDEDDPTISISRHECECDDTSLDKKIHTEFVIGENNSLESPSVKVLFGTDSKSYKVSNWKKRTSSTTYTGLNDVTANNSCPSYLIYVDKSFSNLVYFSDSANLTAIRSDIAKQYSISTDNIYSVSCNKKTESSTPGGNPKFEKPEYDNPSVNTQIVTPFTPDDNVVSCGSGYMTDIPTSIVSITKIVYLLIQILVPISLVIFGSFDLMKSVMAQKEDEIKKGQQTFIKRLIAAIIIFFVFAIVKLIVGIVSNDDTAIIGCMNCFLSGECD